LFNSCPHFSSTELNFQRLLKDFEFLTLKKTLNFSKTSKNFENFSKTSKRLCFKNKLPFKDFGFLNFCSNFQRTCYRNLSTTAPMDINELIIYTNR